MEQQQTENTVLKLFLLNGETFVVLQASKERGFLKQKKIQEGLFKGGRRRYHQVFFYMA